ncbi:hypothetical protein [Mycolicibacterium sp.]|uniref:hypothetical protein n=1 Tax=Mycolicibacterium sp. TaxID=2320850 RepID=UPI00355EEF0C
MSVHPVLPALVIALLAVLFLGARFRVLPRKEHGRSRSALWRWGGVTAAGVLLLVAALRPVVGEEPAAAHAAGADAPNVFVLLDRSPGMAAPMSQARNDIDALLDRYPGARFAVIEFDAEPDLRWPLSADTWSLRPVLDAVRPQPRTPENIARANAGAAGTVLRYQLISAAQQYPRADNLVFYLGAGAPEAEVPQREIVLPEDAVDGGAVLGRGAGAQAASPAGDTLRGVAEQIGVPYLARAADTPLDADALGDGAGRDAESPPSTAERTELYWVPAGLAALLLLAELYLVLRGLRRELGASAPMPSEDEVRT